MQRGTLLDPEPVLLVDHHQPEVGELHVLLEQGMGADHDARLAAGSLGQRLPAAGGVQRPGQQGHPGPTLRAAEKPALGSAAWPPESTTWSIARSATTVLPEPTSPCSSRCIGWPWPSSDAISSATLR